MNGQEFEKGVNNKLDPAAYLNVKITTKPTPATETTPEIPGTQVNLWLGIPLRGDDDKKQTKMEKALLMASPQQLLDIVAEGRVALCVNKVVPKGEQEDLEV